MDKKQEMFLNFITERVKDGAGKDVKELLEDVFKKQDEGSFNALHAASVIPKITAMLKPEHLDEAKEIFENFLKKL